MPIIENTPEVMDLTVNLTPCVCRLYSGQPAPPPSLPPSGKHGGSIEGISQHVCGVGEETWSVCVG